MSLQIHTSGPLAGKVTADNGGDLSNEQRAGIALQRDLIRRMHTDSKFREAVRLAARADGVINGGETAFEQIHRHQLVADVTTRGLIAQQNRLSRITRTPSGIIC